LGFASGGFLTAYRTAWIADHDRQAGFDHFHAAGHIHGVPRIEERQELSRCLHQDHASAPGSVVEREAIDLEIDDQATHAHGCAFVACEIAEIDILPGRGSGRRAPRR